MHVLFALVCLVGATPADKDCSYSEGYEQSKKTGIPMIVVVSTEWCPACQVMKRKILPVFKESPLFKKVIMCYVNPDHEPDLARQLTGGGPIPQMVLYHKQPRGWLRRVLIGSQTVEQVESFVSDGVKEEEKK